MHTLNDIKDKLTDIKVHLSKKYPIESLALFGSYARSEQSDQSDLDLLIEFNGKVGIEFIDIAEEIERELGMRVDLVSKNGVKSRYLKAIEEDLIYV